MNDLKIMKNRYSKFLRWIAAAVTALAALALTPRAHAQSTYSTTYVYTNIVAATGTASQWGPLTNIIAAASTNTAIAGPVIFISNYEELSIAFTAAMPQATNTSAVTLLFKRSVDGTNYESSPGLSVTATMNGTNVVTGLNNLAAGSVRSIQLAEIRNPNTNPFNSSSNLLLVAGFKPTRFGAR